MQTYAMPEVQRMTVPYAVQHHLCLSRYMLLLNPVPAVMLAEQRRERTQSKIFAQQSYACVCSRFLTPVPAAVVRAEQRKEKKLSSNFANQSWVQHVKRTTSNIKGREIMHMLRSAELHNTQYVLGEVRNWI
jgi:hypothetical protein